MTEQKLYERCMALGVCDGFAMHKGSEDWYYCGSYMQIEHAHTAIEKRLAAKVRSVCLDAYCCPATNAGWLIARQTKAYVPIYGATELEAWLAAAESIFGAPAAPQEAETKPVGPSDDHTYNGPNNDGPPWKSAKPVEHMPYVNPGPYPDKREPTADELRAARERHAANAKPAEPDRSVSIDDAYVWCGTVFALAGRRGPISPATLRDADFVVAEYRKRFGQERGSHESC